MSQVTLELAELAVARLKRPCTFSISTQNELFEEFSFLRDHLFAIDTGQSRCQALLTGRVVAAARMLRNRFASDHTSAIISLMPHIWSPWMTPVIQRSGIRHVAVVHDAHGHPGDLSGLATPWLLREAAAADHIITLSQAVAGQLVARGTPKEKLSVLFHPDLSYGPIAGPISNHAGPLRILFFGRILRYKGLELLLDAIESLRARDVALSLDIYGEGRIKTATRARLSALGAKVENRWLDHREFKEILSCYDLVAVPHIEASQSGVVAAAFGAGLPVVATPVGGLVEQITRDVTGVIADSVTASALATAIRKVADDRALLARLQRGVIAQREERSIERFFDKVCEIALCTT